jgi:hypothetical protein
MVGIVGDCLVGPHDLPHRPTGNHYRDFLLRGLPKLLEDVPLAVSARMRYMHNSVPCCASCHGQWIGRGGPTLQARFESTGFLPLGAPKHPCVCSSSWQRRGTSSHCGWQTIRNCPGISERMRRAEACIEFHGGHFEHLLLVHSFSYNSIKLNVSRHMLILTLFDVLVYRTQARILSVTFSYILYMMCSPVLIIVCLWRVCIVSYALTYPRHLYAARISWSQSPDVCPRKAIHLLLLPLHFRCLCVCLTCPLDTSLYSSQICEVWTARNCRMALSGSLLFCSFIIHLNKHSTCLV